MSELRYLLLIAVLAIGVRLAYLYEIQDSPLLSYPSGVAALFAGDTTERAAGLDHPLPAAPIYRQVVATALRIADGDPFPAYLCQAIASTAACLLLCLLSTTFFSSATGIAAGIAAAVYGPSILVVPELTPTTWSTLLQLMFLLSVIRPPIRQPSFRWPISALLLALALVESLPVHNLLPEPGNLAAYATNLFHLIRGQELLPDLDPYLLSGQSTAIGPLLWDEWLAFPFGLILPVAAPGLLLFARGESGRTIEGKVLLMFVFASAVVFGIFAPDARQRLPLALLMLPFAALAVENLCRNYRRGRFAAILCLLVVCNISVSAPAHLAGNAHHYYWMGTAYVRQGMTVNAIGAYQRAIARTPAHALATPELARLYLDTGRPKQALALCQQLLRSHPGAPEVLLLQGDAFAVTGRMDDALFAYEHIRSSGTSTVELLVRLGETYRALGRIEPAADAFAEAVAVRPDSSALRYQLAELYDLGERTEMAIEQYRALLLEDPKNHLLHARLGGALLEEVLGDDLFDVNSTLPVDPSRLTGAETHFNEAIRLRPDYLGARQLLALLLTRQQRYSEAIAQLEQVLEVVPDDPYPHLFLGMLNERAGNQKQARRHLATYNRLDRGKRLEGAAKAEVERVLGEMLPNLIDGR